MPKIVSWNVNGIRSATKQGFTVFVECENPDIICLQEIKAEQDQVDLPLRNYFQFWNPSKTKKGYSGTAIFTKAEPLNVTYGLSTVDSDPEGRVITAEFKDYFLVTAYVPNSQRGLRRLQFRLDWDSKFREYVGALQNKKEVVICGDLNVAHKSIDLHNPKINKRNPGFTIEERASFSQLLAKGFVDTFRHFNLEPNNYTWWSYMHNARQKNIGWRIDYFCVSKNLLENVISSEILSEIHGSDHCPVKLIIDAL